MSAKLEIERKFFIEYPNLDLLDIIRILDITQIYLMPKDDNTQRRIRKIVCDDNITLTYTEKVFLSPTVREELEYKINENEFNRLLEQADENISKVEKKRVIFNYNHQVFEMDLYPFSDEYAILEIELENSNEQIDFPDCINVISEVSDDAEYSNASLSTKSAFPDIVKRSEN